MSVTAACGDVQINQVVGLAVVAGISGQEAVAPAPIPVVAGISGQEAVARRPIPVVT